MKVLLDYLEKAEGTTVHRLKGELDITAPYGIYKYRHPKAEMFTYLDEVANNVGVYTDSKEWDKAEIDSISIAMDDRIVRTLAAKFYDTFLKGAKLYLFPDECKIAMFSLYTNSPKYCWMSVQDALIDMKKERAVEFKTVLSGADGSYGNKTKLALEHIQSLDNGLFFNLYFEKLMLLAMKTRYAKLIKANPGKYLEFSNGWDNRVNKLAEMR